MMIVGIGIDLVNVDRVREMVEKWEGRFLNRIFTPAEQAYSLSFKRPYPHLAARFAVKEAVLKAFGTGLRHGILWTEIEVRRESSGKPAVVLHGKAKAFTDTLGVSGILASVSHDSGYSIGQVILVK
jgi:holo-[acyl-carrier protein] synthase